MKWHLYVYDDFDIGRFLVVKPGNKIVAPESLIIDNRSSRPWCEDLLRSFWMPRSWMMPRVLNDDPAQVSKLTIITDNNPGNQFLLDTYPIVIDSPESHVMKEMFDSTKVVGSIKSPTTARKPNEGFKEDLLEVMGVARDVGFVDEKGALTVGKRLPSGPRRLIIFLTIFQSGR
ncbi:hypothetical protein BJ165DRAFT_1405026 [Panaeolus papilionaceus]|nr:hypothetical protein BJ165DRAFT_1405026 [Panaeolus papilionaceus]